MRDFFLACSTSPWLRERATRYGFVRRAVSRFMPGEAPSDAIGAGLALRDRSIGSVFTYLGENVSDPTEAQVVTEHYLDLLDRIRKSGLGAEVSVKLTQLGLDLSAELCHANLKRIIEHADAKSVVWIDMEASDYVDATLDLYRRARAAYPNVGVCLQAYLYRTAEDLRSLIPLGAAIRLVKGAYKEPADRAFPRKKDVDENYFALAERLLADEARAAGVRAAMATHDLALIRRIRALPAHLGGRTPAVALTAYARGEDAQKAFAAGYQMHIAKPVEPFELATVVANLGGRSLRAAHHLPQHAGACHPGRPSFIAVRSSSHAL